MPNRILKLYAADHFAETLGTPTKATVKRYLRNQSRGTRAEVHVGTGEMLEN